MSDEGPPPFPPPPGSPDWAAPPWNDPALRDVPPAKPSTWRRGEPIPPRRYPLGDVLGGAFAIVRLNWRATLPYTLAISAPFAFAYAFVSRNLPTMAETFRRSAEGIRPTNAYAGLPGWYWAILILRTVVVYPFVTVGLVHVIAASMVTTQLPAVWPGTCSVAWRGPSRSWGSQHPPSRSGARSCTRQT